MMVSDYIPLFENIFSKCVEWTHSLFLAVDGFGYVISAFILVLIIGLFLMPLRGGSVSDGGAFSDFVSGSIYKPKYSNGRRVKSDPNYKGKYVKRSSGGHRATPKG